MISHRRLFICDGWYTLNEAHHRLVTLTIKTIVISSVNVCKSGSTVFEGVCRYRWLNIIPKIGHKSETIIKLKFDGLIVNSSPSPLDEIRLVALLLRLAEVCLSQILILKRHLYYLFLGEGKLKIFINNLESVGHFMGTNILSLK